MRCTRWSRIPRRLPLDRRPHQRPVLRPRAVVVLDVLYPEELVEDEPRVRRSLTDPAVRDDLAALGYALLLVERSKVVGRLERPVVVGRLPPRDVPRARDMARHLSLLLGKVVGSQLLAPVLLRGPNVDEHRRASLRDPGEDVFAQGSQVPGHRLGDPEVGLRIHARLLAHVAPLQ